MDVCVILDKLVNFYTWLTLGSNIRGTDYHHFSLNFFWSPNINTKNYFILRIELNIYHSITTYDHFISELLISSFTFINQPLPLQSNNNKM